MSNLQISQKGVAFLFDFTFFVCFEALDGEEIEAKQYKSEVEERVLS